MSELIRFARSRTGMRRDARAVLEQIALFQNPLCYASLAHLGRLTMLSKRAVIRIVADLEEDGFLLIERRPGRGQTLRIRVSCDPALVPEASGPKPRAAAHARKEPAQLQLGECPGTGASGGTEKGDSESPFQGTEKGDRESPFPVGKGDSESPEKVTPGSGKGDSESPNTKRLKEYKGSLRSPYARASARDGGGEEISDSVGKPIQATFMLPIRARGPRAELERLEVAESPDVHARVTLWVRLVALACAGSLAPEAAEARLAECRDLLMARFAPAAFTRASAEAVIVRALKGFPRWGELVAWVGEWTAEHGIVRPPVPTGDSAEAESGMPESTPPDSAPDAADSPLGAAWGRVREALRRTYPDLAGAIWLRQLQPAGIEAAELLVELPTPWLRDRVRQEHAEQLLRAWRAEFPELQRIQFRVAIRRAGAVA